MQDNYEIIYGDLEIEEVDQRAYIRLKRYEGILGLIKRGIFIAFFIAILCFSQSEIKLEADFFDNLSSTGIMLIIISFVIVLRMFSVYLGRFFIYSVAKRAYRKELSRINKELKFEEENIISLVKEIIMKIKRGVKVIWGRVKSIRRVVIFAWRMINFIWRTIKIIILPDFEAAKFFKGRIRRFAVTYIPHKHKGETKPGQESPQALDVKCNNAFDKDGLCIQCNDSIKFMTKFYVKFSNWCNVMSVMILVFLIICLGVVGNSSCRTMCIFIIFLWLLLRMISRTWEIARAFYNDVVRVGARIFNHDGKDIYLHSWKNSYIRKPLRISLAIHSLLELILMFTCAYILTFTIFGSQLGFQVQESVKLPTQEVNSVVENKINEIEKEITLPKVHDYIVEKKVYEFFVYAISICFFNISYINYGLFMWNVLHVWQISMSMVMIILCIAAYLGNSDDMHKRESEFFSRTLKKIKTNNAWSDLLRVIKKSFNMFKNCK
ncbi:hypothetical protein [Bacillus pseudomycoides]|uniref:hypothetical protein n=1 Tax=Bacillus pseudomycoides TaxID=64104 RepID=UPI0015CF1F9A|nr:hypothetical protein [Bacillus pseudomycoides]